LRTNYPGNIDPLELLLSKHAFDLSLIDQIATGQKYTGIMLRNGQIGVCANLNNLVCTEKNEYQEINICNIVHRIILTAYFNALLNYSEFTKEGKDIAEDINFRKYSNLVMIGYFRSLVNYFKIENIPLTIFDMRRDDKTITEMAVQKQVLLKADAVILTSTAFFNQTFSDIIQTIKSDCHVFLLGPSSIMAEEMRLYKKIKKIFGATFSNSDHRILEIIRKNGGTRDFLKYENKRIFENITNK
jgi:uncharacterized protein (DUF4213/DUF364 family)